MNKRDLPNRTRLKFNKVYSSKPTKRGCFPWRNRDKWRAVTCFVWTLFLQLLFRALTYVHRPAPQHISFDSVRTAFFTQIWNSMLWCAHVHSQSRHPSVWRRVCVKPNLSMASPSLRGELKALCTVMGWHVNLKLFSLQLMNISSDCGCVSATWLDKIIFWQILSLHCDKHQLEQSVYRHECDFYEDILLELKLSWNKKSFCCLFVRVCVHFCRRHVDLTVLGQTALMK